MKSYISTICSLVLLGMLSLPRTHAQGHRAIPDDNLAYPVLMTLKESGNVKALASGFYLNGENHMYLVTARHILFTKSARSYILSATNATCLSYPRDPNDTGRIELELDLQELHKKKLILHHRIHDTAIVRIADLVPQEDGQGYKLAFVEGVKKLVHAKSGLVGLNISNTRPFEKVLISNDVFLFGYPTSIGIKETAQIDPKRPLLRKGIIAGKNASKRTIIIDCPTYYGNSGGPVMMVEQVSLRKTEFPIIGLVSAFVPFKETWLNITHKTSHWEISNSGYSVVTPIDVVLELLPKDVKRKSGDTLLVSPSD